jgi:hypothetical protein
MIDSPVTWSTALSHHIDSAVTSTTALSHDATVLLIMWQHCRRDATALLIMRQCCHINNGTVAWSTALLHHATVLTHEQRHRCMIGSAVAWLTALWQSHKVKFVLNIICKINCRNGCCYQQTYSSNFVFEQAIFPPFSIWAGEWTSSNKKKKTYSRIIGRARQTRGGCELTSQNNVNKEQLNFMAILLILLSCVMFFYIFLAWLTSLCRNIHASSSLPFSSVRYIKTTKFKYCMYLYLIWGIRIFFLILDCAC